MSKPSSFIRPRGAPLAAAGVPLPPRAWALRTSDPGHRFRSRPLPVAATAGRRMGDAIRRRGGVQDEGLHSPQGRPPLDAITTTEQAAPEPSEP
jgi:hypothetical protein